MALIPSASLCEVFQRTAALAPDRVALRTPGDAVVLTWGDYADQVRRVAGALAGLGVGRGDTVALMMTNRPEFNVVDTAVLHLGATPYSIYNTSSPEQVAYVVGNARTRVAVVEDQFRPLLPEGLEHVLDVTGVQDLPQAEGFDFEASWRGVGPDDVATLIYTSGTTGAPKGVEITHANILAEADALDRALPFGTEGRTLSFLPAAHIADRAGTHYAAMAFGLQITHVADPKTLAQALTDVRPTVWAAVPRVWEKIRAGILAKVDAEPDQTRRDGFAWALDVGLRTVRLQLAGEEVPAELAGEHAFAEEVVFAPLRALLGFDQLDWAVAGAAAIAPETQEFFLALGVRVAEVWGMSELTGVATYNPLDRIKVGTVGIPVEGLEVKLAEDGELLVRGPIVMRGYREDPVRTSETLDDEGWLHTGDVATIDDEGYVRIVDRKKELIINAAGKNMSPANIENAVQAALPLAGAVVVVGDNRPYNVALIVLDPDAAAAFADREGLPLETLAEHPVLRAAVQAGVDQANARLSRVEQVKRFVVLPTYWLPGGEELTPTMKLRRRPIAVKYATEIAHLYAG
jgi:long-subunit acyl-CoA synthetase (AMP-forming)